MKNVRSYDTLIGWRQAFLPNRQKSLDEKSIVTDPHASATKVFNELNLSFGVAGKKQRSAKRPTSAS